MLVLADFVSNLTGPLIAPPVQCSSTVMVPIHQFRLTHLDQYTVYPHLHDLKNTLMNVQNPDPWLAAHINIYIQHEA